jgi:hypothetical protein
MPDSIRLKEIHQALEAQTYSTYTSTDTGDIKPRIANLGYFIKRIANVLGITALADGTTYSPKAPELVSANDQDPETDLTTIPAPFRFGHWGYGSETVTEEQLKTGEQGTEGTDAPLEDTHEALVYEFASNKFVEDPNSGENNQIIPSGYALVRNIPQLIRQIMDDVDKGVSLQEGGAFVVRSVEDVQTDPGGRYGSAEYKPKIARYEGLNSAITEILFMLSEISRRTANSQLSSMVSQAEIQELLYATGLPITPKSFKANIGLEDQADGGGGEDIESKIWYPGIAPNATDNFQMQCIILKNIAPLLGQAYGFSKDEQEKIKQLSPEELEDYIAEFKNEM